MSVITSQTASTQFVQVGDISFAYRRFGKRGGTPLVLLNYFAANMDDWDPAVTDGFAVDSDVIIFDYPGIGSSTGKTPPNVEALTARCVDFFHALDLQKIDVVGFSLGGMIAQQLGADYPELIRRIIVLGTGPRGGEGMTFTELSTDELNDPEKLLMFAFFTDSETSTAAGREYIKRIKLRTTDLAGPVTNEAAESQLAAIREWGKIPEADRFAMLGKIQQPTLIVHGNKDVVVMPVNALLLAQHLSNGQLIMYPDASHGAQSQHVKNFLEQVRLFLAD